MGKKNNKWRKKPKFYRFGMAFVENENFPKIDKTADTNWNELSKELKLSEKSKIIKKKKRNMNKPKLDKPIETPAIDEPTYENESEIQQQQQQQQQPQQQSQDEGSLHITKHLAIDCEMVGVGINGKEHMLARCSIVNTKCEVIYDKFVKPREPVVDYRYKITGIKPENIENGEEFEIVQKEVSDITKERVLVGHTLRCDLKVLFLDHPRKDIREISGYKPLKEKTKSHRPGLRLMTEILLGKSIQKDHHDSTEDAIATMQLYLLVKKNWERSVERDKTRRNK